MPRSQADGKKFITTRFENQWRWDPELREWVIKARFVAREFK